MSESSRTGAPRPSRVGRWRAAVLVAVHVALIGHVLWWWYRGRAMTPLEPSEAMAFSKEGILNAGLVLFAVAGLSTLIFGRFFCGWACHMVALQDACRWLMLRFGVRPMPFRSRLLRWVPLGAFLYMFLWPVIARWLDGTPQPGVTGAEWTTNALWQTFPGLWVSVIGLVICGLWTVWFLGSKGLCNYACPYGALFGAADVFAPGRIRVDDSCEGCGHCTAVCSSDVQVHREVAQHGMVVDPGCLKCMDCVSVCPNHALSFSFGKPAAFGSAADAKPAPRPQSAPTWGEELLIAGGFLLFFFATWGIYGQIPFLVALSLGAIGGWVSLYSVRLLRRADLRSGPWRWKKEGRWTSSGVVAGLLCALSIGAAGHAIGVQLHAQRRDAEFLRTAGWRTASLRGGVIEPNLEVRAALAAAAEAADRAGSWGLLRDDRNAYIAAWLKLSTGDSAGFEAGLEGILERRPGFGEMLFQLGHFRRATGRRAEALQVWEAIPATDGRYLDAQIDRGITLHQDGQEQAAHALLDALREEGFNDHELHDLDAALDHQHG